MAEDWNERRDKTDRRNAEDQRGGIDRRAGINRREANDPVEIVNRNCLDRRKGPTRR